MVRARQFIKKKEGEAIPWKRQTKCSMSAGKGNAKNGEISVRKQKVKGLGGEEMGRKRGVTQVMRGTRGAAKKGDRGEVFAQTLEGETVTVRGDRLKKVKKIRGERKIPPIPNRRNPRTRYMDKEGNPGSGIPRM